MFGGPPIMSSPVMFAPPPGACGARPYGTPPVNRVPAANPTSQVPAVRAPSAPAARAQAPAPAKQVFRGLPPEEARPVRPAPVVMPAPERLGVTVARPAQAGLDWEATGRRVKELGLVGFHLDPLPDGGCRFTCWLPGTQPGVNQRIEAHAASEAEAVRLGLERAEQCKSRRP